MEAHNHEIEYFMKVQTTLISVDYINSFDEYFFIMLANVEQLENLSKLPLWVMGDYES